jgi:DNA-directed RNA polymerase specialized sigma24 family protein
MTPLLAALDGYIESMAFKMCPGAQDDAAQSARIAVWQRIRKCDPARPTHSVRGWLLTTAANAIRDEARRHNRHLLPQADVATVLADVPGARPPDDVEGTFHGLLREYLDTIRNLGGLAGVRQACANRHGCSPSQMSILFREAAAEYAGGDNL